MIQDTTLQKNVIEELSWDPALSNTEIGVAAKDGVVTLSGSVKSYSQRYEAEKTTLRVHGVRALANELVVKPLIGDAHSDTDIAHAVMNAFRWHVGVPEDKIQVDVADGWVSLRGTVDWDFQRRAAEAAIRHLAGVRGLLNQITVTPKASATDVKSKIEAAFKRNAEIDSTRIHVTTYDGKVTLTGTARSWAERSDAERAAWAAPGVKQVEDLIVVGM